MIVYFKQDAHGLTKKDDSKIERMSVTFSRRSGQMYLIMGPSSCSVTANLWTGLLLRRGRNSKRDDKNLT